MVKILNRFEVPFIIAEMSGNHNQSLERALSIVDAAAESGVDAIKIQTYTADSMTISVNEGEFLINDPNSLWNGSNLYELYKSAYTPWEWHAAIFQRAKEKGILCFSSPFDEKAVDFLESFDPPFYKIASFENTDHRLLKKVASTGKPVIMSTGVASVSDLIESKSVLENSGCKNIFLLKCTSAYPAKPEDANLLTIPHMKELFNCEIGLSDHTPGIGVAIASVALGAKVIEKHFTLKRSDGGVDSAFSLEPYEMKSLVEEAKRAYRSLGMVKYSMSANEQSSQRFKRSIYVVRDIKKGEKIEEANVRVIRPGFGLEPKYLDEILDGGYVALSDIKRGTALSWKQISRL